MNKVRRWLVATGLLALAAGCDGQATVATTAPAEQQTAGGSDTTQASLDASYAEVWGPTIGAPIPLLDAPDQRGDQQTLASLSGDQGMLLFLNRSADW